MHLRVTVNGVAYDVEVELPEENAPPPPPRAAFATPPHAAAAPPPPSPAPAPAAAANGKTLVSPIPGTVAEIPVVEGQTVEPNAIVIVLDAMKMNMPLSWPAGGKVKQIHAVSGAAVKMGQPLIEFE